MAAPSKKTTWRRRLLALAVSLFVSLLLAEVAARLLRGAPMAERLPLMQMVADRDCGWCMAPSHDHFTYTHAVHVNALGLRGPELAAKAPDELRVLVLGDSNVYGQGVAEADTLPSAIGAALAASAPGRRWTVVNAGHRAYDTRQELALLGKLIPTVQPDVVVVGWYWNDLQERDIEATFQRLQGKDQLTFDTHSKVEGMERVRWELLQLARSSALVMLLYDVTREGHFELPADYIAAGMQRLEGYLGQMQQLAKHHRFDMLFTVIPDANALMGPHTTANADARAMEVAARVGMPALDLRAAAKSAMTGRWPPVLPYDGHYNPAANAAMGRAIAEQIVARGLPTHRH